jgi:hypothetical protein
VLGSYLVRDPVTAECSALTRRHYPLLPGESDTLLLRPVFGLAPDSSRRPPPGGTVDPLGLLAITIWPLVRATACELPLLFWRVLEPALSDTRITVLASYATERSENTFPSLPVPENEGVFVWMAMFDDEAARARHVRALEQSSRWSHASQVIAEHLVEREEVLRLFPTARSALHT